MAWIYYITCCRIIRRDIFNWILCSTLKTCSPAHNVLPKIDCHFSYSPFCQLFFLDSRWNQTNNSFQTSLVCIHAFILCIMCFLSIWPSFDCSLFHFQMHLWSVSKRKCVLSCSMVVAIVWYYVIVCECVDSLPGATPDCANHQSERERERERANDLHSCLFLSLFLFPFFFSLAFPLLSSSIRWLHFSHLLSYFSHFPLGSLPCHYSGHECRIGVIIESWLTVVVVLYSLHWCLSDIQDQSVSQFSSF